MEALRSDTVHTPDSIRTLSRINTHHVSELSKEKEEELLYGAGDDGDEEDALSDDSMRLRLSDDDEVESEDVLPYVLDNQQNKSKNNKIELEIIGKSKDVQASPVPEKDIMKDSTTMKETSSKEDCSGNVSTDGKVISDVTKDTKRNENGPMRLQITNMPHRQHYESQWRFSNSPRARSFRSINHLSYNRYYYMTPRGHHRFQSYDYNIRFQNTFFPFEQGRGSGKYASYSKLMHDNRQQKRGFKSTVMKKSNGSIESHQNLASSSNTNISLKTEVDNSIKDANINSNKIIENNALHGECSIRNKKINNKLNELLNKTAETTNDNDYEESIVDINCVNNSLEVQRKIKFMKEHSQSNDSECKDIPTVKTNMVDGTSNEKFTNSDGSNKQTDEINKSSTNDIRFYIKDDNSEITNCIEKNSTDNQKQNETIKIITDTNKKEVKQVEENCEFNTSQQSVEVNKKIELPGKNCKNVSSNLIEEKIVNNEITIDKEVINHKMELFSPQKENVSVQSTKSNENENNILKADSIVLNDLINSKDDNEIKIIQTDLSTKPIVRSEKCDNDHLNDNNSTNSTEVIISEDQLTHSKIDVQDQSKNSVEENAEFTEKENSMIISTNNKVKLSENIESVLDENNLSSVQSQNESLNFVTDAGGNSGDCDKRTAEVPVVTQRRRRRTKKMIITAMEATSEHDKQVRESGRQKRRTAKNAEEIIRKKFLNHDSDLESSDDSEKFVIVNPKINQDVCPLSPPSLKRNYSDTDCATMNGNIKKIKITSETLPVELATKENNSQNIKKLNYVHKFFQRDLKEKLPKLKQEELEELLIQKIVETITMRGEIGKLREQARISERNQEVTRAKCQQLAKQIKDFEMVLSRNAADRRANNDKPIPPIKINRSVGLQVNFITDHGMQNLRQLQQNSNMKSLHISNSNNAPNTLNSETNNASSPRKGIKVRSPRRTEPISGQTPVVSQNYTQSPNIMPTITPAALVVAKPVDTQHTLALSNQSNVQQMISNQQAQSQQSQQTIVLNGKFPNQINRQGAATANIASRTNDLIDLTDEEEKSKAASASVATTTITDQQINLTQKTQPCFQRVIQTIPGNVAITSQPPSIRVVQPASQPTPTALVNNMNARPRLAYVMQSSVGPTRQLLITPNSSPMRPVTSCNRASFSTLTYKTGISTIANGTVRVLTTSATSDVQLNKHPAPLPDTRNYAANPVWKLPPPAPSLKISKVANGIVLSWNMNLSDKYADIASYQLYAYQEVAGVPPNTSLWKKVGDVRALPLPMACTLTQFSEGNNYYFAVRAVDTHSRKGQYSIPGNISL